MAMLDNMLDWAGRRIANRVTKEPEFTRAPYHTDIELMKRVLRPGDVVLIDGRDKVAAAIRYLTQSTWSHAALYVGPGVPQHDGCSADEPHTLIEVNLKDGCICVPLSKYEHYPTRICRPFNLTDADRASVIAFMRSNIGLTYDTRNIFDLVRYLAPNPPVPRRWRRRMLALGSGTPTRAICSTLLARAFQNVRYPILPKVEKIKRGERGADGYTAADILHIRHHSLFTPRDFDISPYFEIVKPTIAEGFNYKGLTWGDLPAAVSEGVSTTDQSIDPAEETNASTGATGSGREHVQ